ncbi:MAG: hypothetical protein ACM3UU_10010 [Ignavibacteriales bacterium]
MRKHLFTISLLILIILVTSCTKDIERDDEVRKDAVRQTINTQALAHFFGEWNTTRCLIIPKVYSKKELKERDMVGHKVIIKTDLFCDASLLYKKPYYIVSDITENKFVGENIGTYPNRSLGRLNIRNKSTIKKLDVYSDKSLDFLIETFYLEDENTLITNSNYNAFYELKRIRRY